MESYRRANFSNIGNLSLQNSQHVGAAGQNLATSHRTGELRQSQRSMVSQPGGFSRTAEMSLGIPNMPTRRNLATPKKQESSSEESEEEDGNMFQMMAMAQMMRQQPGENDEQTRLIQELQRQNESILKLKENFSKNGTPYANQMTDRIQYLEKLLMESDKKQKDQNSGYFFNQMLMMMMMNPSRPPSRRLLEQSYYAADAPDDDGWPKPAAGTRAGRPRR